MRAIILPLLFYLPRALSTPMSYSQKYTTICRTFSVGSIVCECSSHITTYLSNVGCWHPGPSINLDARHVDKLCVTLTPLRWVTKINLEAASQVLEVTAVVHGPTPIRKKPIVWNSTLPFSLTLYFRSSITFFCCSCASIPCEQCKCCFFPFWSWLASRRRRLRIWCGSRVRSSP